MRVRMRLRNLVGCLALAATLLLTGPGVEIVSADEVAAPRVPSTENGPACGETADAENGARYAALLEALQREQATQDMSHPGQPIPLNNRGYNYGPRPGLDSIQQQLKRVRSER